MTEPTHIVVRSARSHNLRGVDLEIPRNAMVVFTGVSGSGKSSLVYDTLYKEGQRRFMESLSAYARQFLGQMERPDVDAVEGISPTLAIDQKTVNRNPRSTVGTITEIYDHLRLLMARLGLRAPEVIALRLDDIDWRAGELLLRGKGQQQDRVPIPPDVGEALVAYIQHDRISASRALFVTLRAPNGPFKDGQVLNAILKAAFTATGVTPPGPYIGSHVLRHSLATNLMRNGASLAEVGDILRHRSRSSTMIYAKLDIDGLRAIAQPWPVAGGAE